MYNFKEIVKATSSQEATLVAVSKTKPTSAILELFEQGQIHFGENKVQELISKQEQLPTQIKWHFIGHLQTNKVKYIAPFIYLIHGIDSLKLLKEVNKQAAKNERVIDVLLQIHIAQEETKFGLSFQETEELLQDKSLASFENIRICGLMGMATNTEDTQKIKNEFEGLKKFFDELKQRYFLEKEYFKEISMGMSGDYEIALKCGSTMVRIGSLLFGERNYDK